MFFEKVARFFSLFSGGSTTAELALLFGPSVQLSVRKSVTYLKCGFFFFFALLPLTTRPRLECHVFGHFFRGERRKSTF